MKSFVILLAGLLPLLCSSQYYTSSYKQNVSGDRRSPVGPAYRASSRARERRSRCYSDDDRAQKCVPEFLNAGYNGLIDVSNQCGVARPQEYCLQTGYGSAKECRICDAEVPSLSHPGHHLTDVDHDVNKTWWQSETMMEGIQYPNEVNLTLHLGKAFDITYVRLYFRSPRPESFAIYKRTSTNSVWTPYQFYSATCEDTYGLPESSYLGEDETRALCTSEFSDISPLTGGNVPFSTLENRPSAYTFESSAQLQDWVTATDIRIVLDRPNTFGDEVFGDPKVLRSYFYAVYDFAIGGRCKCNGHASNCVEATGLSGVRSLSCVCEHRTMGPTCNECQPFYNDKPWKRADSTDAYECRACDCNGYSVRCYFNQGLYQKTGHGGHCLDCTANRDGPNCQRCRDNYYEIEGGMCRACNCDEQGSSRLQCGSDGTCACKPGVGGNNCDRCEDDYFDFGSQGCKACGCELSGSYGNEPNCDPHSGVCSCKRNVEGQQCDKCKPGYFNMDDENEFGCTPCFCYGHSSICSSAGRYTKGSIESGFVRGVERWKAEEWSGRAQPVSYNAAARILEVVHRGPDKIYFLAPDRFLGDQRASYNQELKFVLRIGGAQSQASTEDIVIEGSGLTVSAPIFAQNNPLPNDQSQGYSFRLHEDQKFGWSPRLSSRDFIALLSNLTSLKIRGTYFYDGKGYLDDVRLETARRGVFGVSASWVEMCTCPEGYVGQYCESCAPGYRHNPPNGGPFASCIPCNCNNHADICDSETGQCICKHNTAGSQCERCSKGYYGNALKGELDDCTPCDCFGGGACIKLTDDTLVCLECPSGYAGPRCDICTDGFFGDPHGRKNSPMPCEKCDCNGNIDQNAVANCNRTTGDCLKCIYNTGGLLCDECLPGFYGDALAEGRADCGACHCNHYGTAAELYGPPVCHQITGQCKCKEHVTGRGCSSCQQGYWNLASGEGCQNCWCDATGAINSTCDASTGQCFCRDGVTSQKCDVCEPEHFGFSLQGCMPCACDHVGSVSLQCDATGQCQCKENVEGRQCNRCRENTYDKEAGCRDCPPCYTLVLDAVSIHRERLAELERLLADIVSNPTVLNDDDFERALTSVMARVEELWEDAKDAANAAGGDSVEKNLDELHERIEKIQGLVQGLKEALEQGRDLAEFGGSDITEAEDIIRQSRELLRESETYLEVQGNAALNTAMARSTEFGQQSARMSQLARNARQMADSQEEQASHIEEIAYDARNTSQEAFLLGRKAFDDQEDISSVIEDLMNKMAGLENRHNSTMSRARESLAKASVVYDEALFLSTTASSISLPNIDVPELKKKAENIEQRARRIKEELDALVQANRELLIDIGLEVEGAKVLVERGIRQQQITTDLLAEVFGNKQNAEKAVQKANSTLEEARKTLMALEEFDQQVQKSKVAAMEAMRNLAEIERLIDSAEAQTREAEDALTGAKTNAQDAENIAQQAQTTAEDASQQAEEVRQQADTTRQQASDLKLEADSLSSSVAAAEQRLRRHETQSEDDQKLVLEAQEQANTAKTRADLASARVRDALGMVEEILQLLNQVSDLDPSLLASLEQRLDIAANAYAVSGIETSVSQLSASRTWQQKQMGSYREEIRLLQQEVTNIYEIKISLPDGCYRRTKLEP
uniref:Laminin subunit gamma-1-like isoform X1 n=3 Tax=Hirondellea gigas TaxID=1518452 RepID=A0A6A7FTH6_9CRUS